MAQMRCCRTLEQGTLPFVCLDGRKFKCSSISAVTTYHQSWLLLPRPLRWRRGSPYLKPANNCAFGAVLFQTNAILLSQ